MALTDLADYKLKLTTPAEIIKINVGALTTIAGRPSDLWTTGPPVGVAPTTAVVPTNSTAGSFGQQNGGSGRLSILGATLSALSPGNYIICDRLSHQGGLSGTVTTAQTTNLPTAALTRYTDGIGVMIGLTIYTQIGANTTTVTASYTDQDNNAAQVPPLVVFGNTGFREAGRMILLPLAVGDSGVKAVASVTVTATTGTAGNFGVTLFKPLYSILIDDTGGISNGGFITGNTFGGMPEIVDNACLFIMCISTSTNSTASGSIIATEV